MITDFFKSKKTNSIITDYYELHRSFVERYNFNEIFNEVGSSLQINSSRKSCVCIDEELMPKFNLYNLPLISWVKSINNVRNKILSIYNNCSIDYGLVHYYHDDKSNISWHSDKEALQSNIFLVNIGGVRRFCLRHKLLDKITTFDLFDGDLFIMKKGCQDTYEHCIKSIKEFNEPRISLTFRQFETNYTYYTYYPLETNIFITNEAPEITTYTKITTTKENIVIGIVCDNQNNFVNINLRECNTSLIKSNLQKAIRRKLENIAIQSTIALICSDNELQLLRRLTIISIEDVNINKYYSIIVWYYIAVINKYKLTEFDIIFIVSYVKLLCNTNMFYNNIILDEIQIHKYTFSEINNDVNCVALYLRLQFGGFNGEKVFINKLISGILDKSIIISDQSIEITHININNIQHPEILRCSIDYHCFPKMIDNILLKLNSNNDDANVNILTEIDVKKYIWAYDSNINSRIQNKTKVLDDNIWKKVIKPKCDSYRFGIMKLLNISKLV